MNEGLLFHHRTPIDNILAMIVSRISEPFSAVLSTTVVFSPKHSYSGPEVLFKTCVAMKFVDDDDDDLQFLQVN